MAGYVYYIHNLSADKNYVDDFVGLVIPFGAYFQVDTDDVLSLLRVGSYLNTFLTTGTVTTAEGTFTYGKDTGDYLFISDSNNPTTGTDVGAAGTTAGEKALIAYRTLRGELASNIVFDGSGTTYLTGYSTLQDALSGLDSQVETISGVSETIQWRPSVYTITADTRLSAGGTIDFGTGATLDLDDTPFSDDEAVTTIANADLTEGIYVLFSGATDRLYKVVGTDLIEQTSTAGLNEGYAYMVTRDLLDSPAGNENQAIYVYTNSDLIKLSDVDWGTPPENYGGKTYTNITAFTTSKSTAAESFIAGEIVYIQDINRFVEIIITGAGVIEDTDWSYVGSAANPIGGASFVVDTTTTASITSAAVSLNADTGELDLTAAGTVDINAGSTVTIDSTTSTTITGGTGTSVVATTGNVALTTQETGVGDIILTSANEITGTADTINLTGDTSVSLSSTTSDNIVELSDAAGVFLYSKTLVDITSEDTITLNTGTTPAAVVTIADNTGAPSVDIADGSVIVLPATSASGAAVAQEVDGATLFDATSAMILTYDVDRTKWISASRQFLQFGSDSADGQYLAINGVTSGLSGFLMPRNMVITACTIISNGNAANNATKQFEIRADGTQIGTTITLTASGNKGTYSATNLNITVNAASYLQIFASATGKAAQNVIAVLEVAYYVA